MFQCRKSLKEPYTKPGDTVKWIVSAIISTDE